MRTRVYKNLSSAMTVCFWCNQPKGEIIAMNEEWGVEPFVVDYKPCEKCKRRWKNGVVIIETTMKDPKDGRPKMDEMSWPTGRIFVITKAWAKKILPEQMYNNVSKGQIMYAGTSAFKNLIEKGKNHGPKTHKKAEGSIGESSRIKTKRSRNQKGGEG